MSLPSFSIVNAAPVRAAAGVKELAWTMVGNVVLHVSLIATASMIPLHRVTWLISAVPHQPPSGDNTVELSAAFLDAAEASESEQAQLAPAMVMQTSPVSTEGTSDVAPRKVDLSPVAIESAPQGTSADSESPAEAAPESVVQSPQTERQKAAQDQPRVDASLSEANSTPSRSAAAAPPAVGSPDALPSEVHSPFPAYPPELLARRIQATVVLRLRIAADGTVAQATVHSTSGYEAMDRAALTGVKSWKFKPAMKNGKPVETIVRKPFTFEIRE